MTEKKPITLETIDEIKNDVDQFLYKTQEVEIVSEQDYTDAGDLLKKIQAKIKRLKDKRLEYTRPLDESKDRIMADFKAISEPLEEFVQMVKSKMLAWAKADQKKKDEEQKKLEEDALEKAKKENQSEILVPVVNTEVRSRKGDFSTSTVKKVWKWKIVDESLIPREYLCTNDRKISFAVTDGTRRIPGIEIYQEEQLSIR